MSLLFRINLALIAVFAVFALGATGYIGPLARHLVKRAAATAAGTEALILQLGTEIESEAERKRFINTCRRLAQAGD